MSMPDLPPPPIDYYETNSTNIEIAMTERFNPFKLEYNHKVPYRTDVPSGLDWMNDVLAGDSQTEPLVIKEEVGVVLNVDSDQGFVSVELGAGPIVQFPASLFRSLSPLRYGQPLTYQIVKNSMGRRVQRFLPRVEEDAAEKNADILALL